MTLRNTRMRTPRKLFLMLMFVVVVDAHGESLQPFSKQETAPPSMGNRMAQLQKQADSGDATAQNKLGLMYANGDGVPKDYTKAVEWFQKAAVQGDVKSQLYLGVMYYEGKGVPKDYIKAAEWYQKAAAQGDASAQSMLGVMYYYGKGLPKNVAKSAEWYLKAAVQANANAQYSLGLIYADDEGVPKDAAKAVEWFQKAAAQGHAGAQYDLGRVYALGEGVPKDAVKAVEWWQKAAAQGNAKAQYELGRMYANGNGVSKDAVKAVEWWQKAAAQGYASAQVILGIMYGLGNGVPQDYVMAHMWSNLASVGLTGEDREQAVRDRDLTASMMSPGQVAEAQRLAREWRPKQSTTANPSSPSPLSPEAQARRSIESTGTGFIVSKAGHVLTNHHVVDGCKEVRAQIPVGKVAVTPVVARDPGNDLALLKLSSPSTMSTATFRDGQIVRQGDNIVAIGFPLHGLLASGANLATGAVSALAGINDDTRYMQISAPVQPGNSGGPLLDLSGNVVGIVVGKLNAIKMAKATGDIPQNVNFAINATVARGFLDAKGVKYETAPSNRKLEAADVGELAKKFTVVVECWK